MKDLILWLENEKRKREKDVREFKKLNDKMNLTFAMGKLSELLLILETLKKE